VAVVVVVWVLVGLESARRLVDGLFGARSNGEEDLPVEADHDWTGQVEGGERGPEDEG